MRYFSLITFNVAIGIILIMSGLNTIQSIYFAGLLTGFTCWGLLLLSEIKKPILTAISKGKKVLKIVCI